MKIMGLTYYRGEQQLLLKGDSALLVNQKPFFIPDCTKQMIAYPALALHVSKLGKNISERFASRYFDAYAPALDLQALDMREEASAKGAAWTAATSLDGSFPVGDFLPIEQANGLLFERNGEALFHTTGLPDPKQAICFISSYMTIRQGDIIYLPLTEEPILLQPEDSIRAIWDGQNKENLFCRIK